MAFFIVTFIYYKTIILPVVLYGCETWSLTLRDEHKQTLSVDRVDRVLSRISGPKRCEVAGGWRKLHNQEYCNLYSSPGMIRMLTLMILAGHIVRMGRRGIDIEYWREGQKERDQ
jgi:hypothetical protein